MNFRKMNDFSNEEKALFIEILNNGYKLTSDVFEDPLYVEIATYEYNKEIYYFRIVTGKVVSYRKLS